MKARRIIVRVLVILLAVAVFMTGFRSSTFTKSACACVTVNQHVVMTLDRLDVLVQQYAAEHDGLFPPYNELIGMVEDEWLRWNLTPRIDVATRSFTFIPAKSDATMIGYAVSDDRREHVLLGIGLTEKYTVKYLFGREISRQLSGYELPVLHPGDTPPEPSPWG